MSKLLQSHRAMGFEAARVTDCDGRELVVLQTAPHREEVVLAHMLRPVTDADLSFTIGVSLAEVVMRARFFGIDREQLLALFTAELERE